MAWFSGCASDRPKPVNLEPISTKLNVEQLWQGRTDAVEFSLFAGARDGLFAVSGSSGKVSVFQVSSGSVAWTADAGAPLQAGVGFNGTQAAVVTRDNDLVVLESGRVVWRHRLPARGVTAPLVAGGRVFVMTVNRVLHAFDVQSGQKIWTLDKPGDALTLAKPGIVASFEGSLLVGQGPRLTAVNPDNGTVRWEVPIANPRGANEVERLADLIGPLSRSGSTVCARAFQSAVGCVDARRGQVLWSRNSGGWQGVGGSDNVLVGADASDRITGWKTQSGEALWTQEKLLYRKLSGVTFVGSVAVLGDSEGWVHFLDSKTGDLVARMPTDGSPIEAPPLVAQDVVLVVTRKGGLFAFRPR